MGQVISNCRHPERQPVILTLCDRQLTIDCLFHYNPKSLQPMPDSETCTTYADLMEAGIRENWTGTYLIDGLPGHEQSVELTVIVQISRYEAIQARSQRHQAFQSGMFSGIRAFVGRRRPVRIVVKKMLVMPAHVISPLYRRFWGIFKTGQLESLGLNWSPVNPGRIIIPPYKQPWLVQSVVAHEAGHIFGIGDAYAAFYRFFSEAPGTRGFMMNSNQRVHPAEIAMMLTAHRLGRMQFFPKTWQPGVFFKRLFPMMFR